jgi:P4 family phage/plasmid primase-like protien
MGKKPWLMYGSAKTSNVEPYLATRAYRSGEEGPEEITLEEVFEDRMEGRKSSLTYYLPRFMSIRGFTEATPLNSDVDAKRTIYNVKKSKRTTVVKKRSMKDVMEDIKLIKDGDIMEMLSDDRAEDYASWIDVGWTLFNIGQGCEEALNLWIDFSRKSSKFVEGECEDKWAEMQVRDKTIASLLAMAKSDNPDKYKEWKDTNVKSALYKSLYEAKPNEWDVAQVIHKLYKDIYICADARKDIWYEFKEHRWQSMDDNIPLKKNLATDVANAYLGVKVDLINRQRTASDDTEKKKLESQESKCAAIVSALKTCDFHNKVIKMCKILFHDSKFLKKMDENRSIFVCENGVVDLEFGIFRDGRPDDYATYCCNQVYHKYSWEDDDVLELQDFFGKVFTNVNRRDYFLDSACATMEGGNSNKTFIVATGDGNNAKTVTFNLLEMVFGDYSFKFPRELFIVSRGNTSSGARPELSRVRGKRLGMLSEIAKTDTLNIGVLKELTGNDSFFARGLYEKGTEIKPMFCLFMACNEPPKVPGHDEATWNRIRVLEFDSKFVMKKDLNKFPVPDSLEDQYTTRRFHAKADFSKRLPDLAPVLLWMLVERFKEYKKTGLREPKEVQLATAQYRAFNDVFLQFVQDKIEKVELPANTPLPTPVATPVSKKAAKGSKTPTPKIMTPATQPSSAVSTPKSRAEKAAIAAELAKLPFLKLAELHSEFSAWYQENHSSYAKEKFNKITLLHEFNKRFGGASKQGRIVGWYGYRIVDDVAEDDDQQKKLKALLTAKVAKNAPKDKPKEKK